MAKGKEAAESKQGPNMLLKAKYSFYSTLVFFLVANPETFKMTQQIFGWLVHIADSGGCPTAAGFFFHSGIFFLILWGIMLFPRDPQGGGL
jgi:hypothetical protein